MAGDRTATDRNISVNRRARYEYEIIETFEAGLVLVGTEVKSLRAGKANLTDAYGKVINREVWLYSAHINPFEGGNRFNHDPVRARKLLMHRREIETLIACSQEKGLALVPLRLYWVRGRAKLELAVGRGKKLHDKRDALKERESKREIERAIRRDDRD